MSTVDILIPFYNAGHPLAEALSSVEAQTYPDWKVILIDDGSTDTSNDIATAFLKKNPLKCALLKSSKPQSGAAFSRNEGIKNATGLYTMCLDADDLLAPFCLQQRVTVMQQNSELDWAVFNQYQVAPGAKQPYPLFNRPVKTGGAAIGWFLKMLPAWQTMAPLWKTKALQKLGGFDGSLYPMEDPDLHLRALLDTNLKMSIIYSLPADCYYHVANKRDDQLISFYKKDIAAKFLYLKKMVDYLPEAVSVKTLKGYHKFIRKGFFLFLSTVLLSRLKGYKKEIQEISLHLKKERIFSAFDILKINLIMSLFTSKSPVVIKLKVKGLVHKFFLAKG